MQLLQANDETLPWPQLFDPLVPTPSDQEGGAAGGGAGDSRTQRITHTQVNAELMRALSLLTGICAKPLKPFFASMLAWMRQHPLQDTQLRFIVAFNEAVRDHPEMKRRSLRQAMADLTVQYGYNWRDLRFNALEAILRDECLESFLDPGVPAEDLPVVRRKATVARPIGGGFRLTMEDGTSAAVFSDCSGFDRNPRIAVHDRLIVRLAKHPDGDIAVRVHERLEDWRAGTIRIVFQGGTWAIVRLTDDSEVFLPGNLYAQLGSPGTGAALSVISVPTGKQRPEIIHARLA